MSDRYQQLVNTPVGKIVSKQIGLPSPVKLERYEPGQAVISGRVLLGGAGSDGGRLTGAVAEVLTTLGAEVWAPATGPADLTFKAIVFDATRIASSDELHEAWSFLHPVIRKLRACGRVIVLGSPPERCDNPPEAIAQRGLEGLTRSIGKEVRRGATAQLLYVEPNAEDQIESTLRFFLSPKSAYVSGQVVRIGRGAAASEPIDWERPLNGKIALVTEAARGIGRSIAQVLARDGAHVVCLDVPAAEDELNRVCEEIGGSSLTVDITDEDGPAIIASHLLDAHGGVDVVVHNAGVTRDKTLGRMSEDMWRTVKAAVRLRRRW